MFEGFPQETVDVYPGTHTTWHRVAIGTRPCRRLRDSGGRPRGRPPRTVSDTAARRDRGRHPRRPTRHLPSLGHRGTAWVDVRSGHHLAEKAPGEVAGAIGEFLRAMTDSLGGAHSDR